MKPDNLNFYDCLGLLFSCIGLAGILGMFAAGLADSIPVFFGSAITAVGCVPILNWCEKRGNLLKP